MSVKGFNIRPLTEFELNDAIKEIDAMPLEQYRDLSVPSLDLGFHKIYMPKSKILDMLQEEKIKLHRKIRSRTADALRFVYLHLPTAS